MPIAGRGRRAEEDAETLTVGELAAELREQRRLQGELLDVLHADGEARTRGSDGSALSKFVAAAVPFVVGILIGVLGTLAAVVGRISTLEAESRAHGDAIVSNAATTARVLETVTRVDARLDAMVRPASGRKDQP